MILLLFVKPHPNRSFRGPTSTSITRMKEKLSMYFLTYWMYEFHYSATNVYEANILSHAFNNAGDNGTERQKTERLDTTWTIYSIIVALLTGESNRRFSWNIKVVELTRENYGCLLSLSSYSSYKIQPASCYNSYGTIEKILNRRKSQTGTNANSSSDTLWHIGIIWLSLHKSSARSTDHYRFSCNVRYILLTEMSSKITIIACLRQELVKLRNLNLWMNLLLLGADGNQNLQTT